MVTVIPVAIPGFLLSGRQRGPTARAAPRSLPQLSCSSAVWLGGSESQGRIAGLPHISLRIRLEMRALGFPAALVFSGTVHQGWGEREVCKGNY